MGYASRNNQVSRMAKEGNITSLKTLRDAEIIRVHPTRAYELGLINYEQLKFIKSHPSHIEILINKMINQK